MSINDLTTTIQGIKDAKEELRGAINAKGGTLADDAKLSEFKDAVEGLPSGGSAFAVDFGEEIATGNPAFIGGLQEDIDYYNQIQEEREAYAAGTGGRSDAEILADPKFRGKIAWWPKGMAIVLPKFYSNLRTSPKFTPTSCSQGFQYTSNLKDVDSVDFSQAKNFNSAFYHSGIDKLSLKVSATNISGLCNSCANLKEVYLECDGIADNITSGFTNCFNLTEAILIIPAVNTIQSLFQGCQVLRKVSIESDKIATVLNAFSEANVVEELSIDITNVDSITGWGNLSALIDCQIKGLKASLAILSQVLKIDSVKYILDNCQARTDGSSYALSLHADVKARFMAKCDEDASYAEALANANAKGLTIA